MYIFLREQPGLLLMDSVLLWGDDITDVTLRKWGVFLEKVNFSVPVFQQHVALFGVAYTAALFLSAVPCEECSLQDTRHF